MHPDYTLDIAGRCPRCGMALGARRAFRRARLRTRAHDGAGRGAGRHRARWRFRVFHPGTGEPIVKFETVHERQFHLFVISQDMTHFQHIHPELQADGTWVIDVTLPKPGYYKVLSDFLRPEAPRSSSRGRWSPRATPGTSRVIPRGSPSRRAGARRSTTSRQRSATIPPPFAAGLYGHLKFSLTDSATGRPVTDLQTYLGAFGHTLIMSEDLNEYVHSHSLDIVPGSDDEEMPQFVIPPGADLETLRGGPERHLRRD
jgi:hypothetical protein